MPDLRQGPAELAVRRLFATAAGGVAVISIVVDAAFTLRGFASADGPARPWAIGALIIIVITGALAPLPRARGLRRLSALGAVAFLLAQAIALPLIAAGAPTPWALSASAPAVLCGVLAAGLLGAWTVLACSAVLLTAARLLDGPWVLGVWVNDMHAFMAGIVLALVATYVLQLSRTRDRAGHAQRQTARTLAAAADRLAANARDVALVRDDVRTTLTAAVGAERIPVAVTRSAHAHLHRQEKAGPTSAVPRSLGATLRADALRLDAATQVSIERDDDRGLPPQVRAAVRTAFRQAIDNSVRHAGATARRRVHIAIDGGSALVDIVDDGVGFDPDSPARERLGMRHHILDSMRDVGGLATIDSAPGAGTRIRLQWSPEPGPRRDPLLSPALRRVGALVLALTFALSQGAVAAVASSEAVVWWKPWAMLLTLLIAAGIAAQTARPRQHAQHDQHDQPAPAKLSAGRIAIVLALIAATLVFGCLSSYPTYGERWFVVTVAFVLAIFAARGRWATGLVSGGAAAVLVVILDLGRGVEPGPTLYSVARLIAIVAIAAALAVGVRVLTRATARLHLQAAADAEKAAWTWTTYDDLATRDADLAALARPMLARLARGGVLDADERARCGALEETLGEHVSAGRLAREPLLSAALRARARGVDVVLADELDGPLPTGLDLDDLAGRMAAEITTARSRAIARLRPAGRGSPVLFIVDGEARPLLS